MRKIKAFIVEDEHHIRDYIAALLEKYFGDRVEICGSSDSVISAMEFLKTNDAELLFLDIELSDGQVFDLLQQIEYKTYRLIFVTGYSEHAIKAIRYAAVDYLMKPIATREFIEAVTNALQHHQQEKQLLEELIRRRTFSFDDYLLINNQHSTEKIPFEQISYLEADGVYTIIHHENKKTIASKPIGFYEDFLPATLFNRCHKSFIVNKFHIRKVDKGRTLQLTLQSGANIPVAARKKEEFNKWVRASAGS